MDLNEWNDELLELRRRWEQWSEMPFPRGCAGVNINGVELVLIDADISVFMNSAIVRGPLSRRGADDLARLVDGLRGAIPFICPEGRPYYERLAELAEVAVRLSRSIFSK